MGQNSMGKFPLLGEMLLNKGKITRAQLEIALSKKSGTRRRIGEVFVDLGYVTEKDITKCLAEQFGFDIVDSSKVKPEPAALGLLSSDVALAHRILPLKISIDCIECVMADPIDFPTTDMIAQLAGKRAVIHIAQSSALVTSIRRAYGLKIKLSGACRPRKTTPKPQNDRTAILDQLDAGVNGYGEIRMVA